MSGHSKWHSIKHKKAAIDAKRGKLFTRIIRELTIAAKIGGGDPDGNPRLRTAIAAAKDVNMPSKNIDNAIKKGAGGGEGTNFDEVTYEGKGPGGVAFIVEATTDNRNRTTGEIRHYFSKYNGELGTPGSMAFLFTKQGVIMIERETVDEDKVMEVALEAGAEDIRTEDDAFVVITEPNALGVVREALEAVGVPIVSAEVENVPSVTKQLEGKDAETCMKLFNALEDHEDVKSVSANFEIDDEE